MVASESIDGWLAARSGGMGTGRFLGRALLDSLTSGSPLVGLCLHLHTNATLADFVFARDRGLAREVIRCRVEDQGWIDECEVWRSPQPAAGKPFETAALLALLEADSDVQAVELLAGGIAVRTPAGSAMLAI